MSPSQWETGPCSALIHLRGKREGSGRWQHQGQLSTMATASIRNSSSSLRLGFSLLSPKAGNVLIGKKIRQCVVAMSLAPAHFLIGLKEHAENY